MKVQSEVTGASICRGPGRRREMSRFPSATHFPLEIHRLHLVWSFGFRLAFASGGGWRSVEAAASCANPLQMVEVWPRLLKADSLRWREHSERWKVHIRQVLERSFIKQLPTEPRPITCTMAHCCFLCLDRGRKWFLRSNVE